MGESKFIMVLLRTEHHIPYIITTSNCIYTNGIINYLSASIIDSFSAEILMNSFIHNNCGYIIGFLMGVIIVPKIYSIALWLFEVEHNAPYPD